MLTSVSFLYLLSDSNGTLKSGAIAFLFSFCLARVITQYSLAPFSLFFLKFIFSFFEMLIMCLLFISGEAFKGGAIAASLPFAICSFLPPFSIPLFFVLTTIPSLDLCSKSSEVIKHGEITSSISALRFSSPASWSFPLERMPSCWFRVTMPFLQSLLSLISFFCPLFLFLVHFDSEAFVLSSSFFLSLIFFVFPRVSTEPTVVSSSVCVFAVVVVREDE
mmetsp:Transcript_40031/g.93978  ORF Transcript_40031/g.93978 Transcript_40031/m.93978 type:complete len:220 (+) Transcript_40031:4845-5504(+)